MSGRFTCELLHQCNTNAEYSFSIARFESLGRTPNGYVTGSIPKGVCNDIQIRATKSEPGREVARHDVALDFELGH